MAISRQKEVRSRDYALLLSRMNSRVLYTAQYHRQHCTLNAFETVWSTAYAQPRNSNSNSSINSDGNGNSNSDGYGNGNSNSNRWESNSSLTRRL